MQCPPPPSCISILFITGWKYYGFHAALWERHLVSVEKTGPVTPRYELLGLNHFIYRDKEKLDDTFLMQTGRHHCVSSQLVPCKEMYSSHQITWRRNDSLHDVLTLIFARERNVTCAVITGWACLPDIKQHVMQITSNTNNRFYFFFFLPLWNMCKW